MLFQLLRFLSVYDILVCMCGCLTYGLPPVWNLYKDEVLTLIGPWIAPFTHAALVMMMKEHLLSVRFSTNPLYVSDEFSLLHCDSKFWEIRSHLLLMPTSWMVVSLHYTKECKLLQTGPHYHPNNILSTKVFWAQVGVSQGKKFDPYKPI